MIRIKQNLDRVSTESTGWQDYAQDVAEAVADWKQQWPDELISGVMFYNGSTITRGVFEHYVRTGEIA